MIRPVAMVLCLAAPASGEEAGWSGGYGGLSFGTDGSGLFLGAMAERGPAVLGLELGAEAQDDGVAVTGRVGHAAGATLLYGLAGVGPAGEGDGLLLGAGASHRRGRIRIGGELRHAFPEDDAAGDTSLGGRVALEF